MSFYKIGLDIINIVIYNSFVINSINKNMPTGVYIRSEKFKKWVSRYNKKIGRRPPLRIGVVHSEETKRKISLSNKGKHSRLFTEDHKKNISLGKKGKFNHFQTEETKEKISKAKKNWAKNNKQHYKKLSLAGILKQQTMKDPTSIEKKVYDELEKRGFLFEKQKLINGKFLVDAYIPSLNLIIEADGDYWHSLDRVKKKDKSENAYLKKCGFNLVRWREADINTDIINLFNQIN